MRDSYELKTLPNMDEESGKVHSERVGNNSPRVMTGARWKILAFSRDLGTRNPVWWGFLGLFRSLSKGRRVHEIVIVF